MQKLVWWQEGNFSIYTWESVIYTCLKPWPNDSNTSIQHIATLLTQYLQAPAIRLQHLNATGHNIVGHNMLHAFGHPAAMCCDIMRAENWRAENGTSVHAQAQHCCTNLAKWLQNHATSTNVTLLREKFDHFQIWANNTQHVAICCNRVAKRTQHVAPNNVTICCIEMLRSFGRSLRLHSPGCTCTLLLLLFF